MGEKRESERFNSSASILQKIFDIRRLFQAYSQTTCFKLINNVYPKKQKLKTSGRHQIFIQKISNFIVLKKLTTDT